MPQMPAMSSTFSFATHVTLWFSGWTTISAITYLLALFLLFALGLFHRFLGALKFQLETKWKANPNVVEQRTSHNKTVAAAIGNPAKGWSHTLRQQPVPLRLAEPEGIETEPLSPTTLSEAEIAKSSPTPNMPFWVPSAPWSAKRDGITATLEFTRALIGYFLCVMVYLYSYKVE